MFDITTNALQTVRYQMPGAVAVRYLARYRTAIYPKATDIALLKQMFRRVGRIEILKPFLVSYDESSQALCCLLCCCLFVV